MSVPVRTVVIDRGSRVAVVNRGPQGPVGPVGSPGDVTGPVVSVVGNLPTFSNTTGNVLADSGVALSSLAVASAVTAALALKVDKVAGYGLSDEDFTAAEKAKLAALSEGTFRGTFDDESSLTAALPVGDAVEGDYAYVVDPVPGAEQIFYAWDKVNGAWVKSAPGSTPSNGAEIKTALFAEPDTNNLTDARLTQLNGTVSQATFNSVIETLTGGAAPTTNVVTDSTTARTPTPGDSGRFIVLTNAAPCTITIQDDATALWTVFPPLTFYVSNAVPVVAPDPGVTVSDPSGILAALVTGSTFTLKKIGADSWVVVLGM